ncbi:MAG: hypothetical protein Q8K99_06755, partial [Actinomycetota bacterium]|nr:hypothetical protein [Actinomycetota bacterium]
MGLTVVTGRANTGKTGVVYTALEDAAARGQDATLLLPSEPDAERARSELAARLPVGVRIAQVDRYLATVWATHGDGRRIVTPAQRAMLLVRCAGGASPGHASLAGRCVARLAEETGFGWREPRALSGPEARMAEMFVAYAGALDEEGLV